MVCVKQVVGDDLIVVVGSVRKRTAAVAVTQSPDTGNAGLQLIVYDDVTAFVGFNSGLVESEIACVGNASDSQENLAPQYFRSTFSAIHVHANASVALRQRNAFCI